MADLYATYAALAAAEVEGVGYSRTAVAPAGATWSSIAIHGGGIETGSGRWPAKSPRPGPGWPTTNFRA